MQFKYRALKNNKIETAIINAEDEDSVVSYLKDNNFFLISVSPVRSLTLQSFLSNLPQFAAKEVVSFTRQLSIMMAAGLTIIQSLDILKKQITHPIMRTTVMDIDKQIRSGNSFSSALKRHPHLFTKMYVALIRSGEATGKLGEVMSKLADDLEKGRAVQNKIKGALIYPVAVLSVMIVLMIVMTTFVMPKLLELYKEFAVDLPFTTKMLIAISQFMIDYWFIVIGGFTAFVIAARSYLSTRAGRVRWDGFLLRIPVIGNVISMGAMVDMTRTMSILIGSGVSILEALEIVEGTTNSYTFQLAIRRIMSYVEKGKSLGDAFEAEAIFPPILIQMITVGESTGKLDETLSRISSYFEAETEIAIKTLTTLIEPFILIILGIAVGLLVFSIITPIYNLTSSFK